MFFGEILNGFLSRLGLAEAVNMRCFLGGVIGMGSCGVNFSQMFVFSSIVVTKS